VYYQGKTNRIFYQTTNYDNVSIECDFLNPYLERSEKLLMTYISDNLYYIDIFFKYTGSYVLRTFKDNTKLNHNIIQVGSGTGLSIYPNENTMI